MEKNDSLYIGFKNQFEYLFPKYAFTESIYKTLKDMALLDGLIYRNPDKDFKYLLWGRIYTHIYRTYFTKNYNENFPFSKTTYLDIYENINEKINYINFRC